MPDVLFAPWRYEYLVADKTGGCIFCEAAASGDDEESLVVFRGRTGVRDPEPVSLHQRPRHGRAVRATRPGSRTRTRRPLQELIETIARAEKILVAALPDRRPERRRQLRLRGRRGRRRPLPRPRRSALERRHELHDRRRGNARRPRGALGDARAGSRRSSRRPAVSERGQPAPRPPRSPRRVGRWRPRRWPGSFRGSATSTSGAGGRRSLYAAIVTATFLARALLRGAPLLGRGRTAADDPRHVRGLRRRPPEPRGAPAVRRTRAARSSRRPTSTAAPTC